MCETDQIRVLLSYDDHLLCAGLAAIFGADDGVVLVGRTGAAPVLATGAADVTVASYGCGLAVLASHRDGARPKVIIVSRRDSEGEIRHALAMGVRGYLGADCDPRELREAVRCVHAGLRHVGASAARRLADCLAGELLTEREIEVMRLLVEGHANKTIARRLNIAVGTVKAHLRSVFQKLDACSRTEAAAVAERRGLLAPFPMSPT